MPAVWQQLQERRAAMYAEQDTILAAVEEAGGEYTDEQRARMAELNTSVQTITQDIEMSHAAARRAAGLPPEQPPAPAPGSGSGQENLPDHWRSFGDFLQAVAEAGRPEGIVDERLRIDAAASGMSAGVSSDGGFLIRTDWSDRLLQSAREASQLVPLCDGPYTMGPGFDSIELPYIDETSRATGSRWGGVQVYRAAEAAAVSASMTTLGLMKVTLEELRGLAYATDRLLKNAPMLEGIVTNAFASEFAFTLDNEIIRGSGAGECLGILNSGDADTGAGQLITVAKETGQDAASVTSKNLSQMWARVRAKYRGNVVWLHNQELETTLDELALIVGATALQPRTVTYGPDGVMRIKGRPVLSIEQASAAGTVGDIMAVDLNQYLLIDQGGLEAASSMHVRFINHEQTFRFSYMINGRPKPAVAVQPFKGAANKKLGPFVTLAARA